MGKSKEETKRLNQIFSFLNKLTLEKKIGFGVLSAALILAVGYLFFTIAYWGRIYPNVTVGGISVSHLTVAQAQSKLQTAQQAVIATPISISYLDKKSSITPNDVAWQYDAQASATRAYQVGRQNNAWRSFVSGIGTIIKVHQLSPATTYNADSLANKLSAIVGPINQPAVDATASYTGTNLTFTSEKAGHVVDADALSVRIINDWQRSIAETISLQLVVDQPDIVLGDSAALKKLADGLASTSLTLKWPGGQKLLSKVDVAQMIDFVGGAATANGQKVLTAEFTQDKARQFLLSYADANINHAAKEPTLAIKDGKLTVTGASANGTVVDLDASAPVVLAALTSAEVNKVAIVQVKAQSPLIDQGNLSSLGITDLIGEGTTSFAGSPADRTANIHRGVQLLTSILIKPGEEFSTIKNLGSIDASNGFVEGLVIKENRTVPDFGGGLCQVSTTLFRSVLAAGLKVTERQNHSYRVSYYEPPVGLDATIFDPAPDFKFVNDTPGYILIQSSIVGTKLTFDLWGSKDGRAAVVSAPQILSTTPAGDPIYTNTDTLDVGTTKQIEHAHDGMVTTATYTVTKNGKVTNLQTFKSIYKPWPAQFLVGTHVPTP